MSQDIIVEKDWDRSQGNLIVWDHWTYERKLQTVIKELKEDPKIIERIEDTHLEKEVGNGTYKLSYDGVSLIAYLNGKVPEFVYAPYSENSPGKSIIIEGVGQVLREEYQSYVDNLAPGC